MLDGNHGGEAFAHVVAGDLRVLVLQEIVGLGELVDGPGERAAETGKVRAAIRIVDGIGVAEHLVVVGVVVLEDDLDVDLGGLVLKLQPGLLGEADGLRVQGRLALVDLLHELLDAILVVVGFRLGAGGPLVEENDLKAGIEEGQLAQALGDAAGLEDGGLAEDLGVGLEGDERAGAAGLADDLELFHGLAALKFHVVDLAAAGDLDFEPLGDGIDALGADAVGAAGEFVAALPVFAAGVERGEHEFDAGQAAVLVDVHRNAAAVVADTDGAVHVDGDIDARAVAGEVFVHGVVEHLGDAVMKRPLVGAADIHAGLLADGFQTLELAELVGVVSVGIRWI